MATIGLFYGSDTGNTQTIAENIAKALGVAKADVYDVSNAKADYSKYDVLVMGTPTAGLGDMQDDMESFSAKMGSADLSGKKVALFGLGDGMGYGDTFCDGMAKLYEMLKPTGAQFIGQVSTDGYTYDETEAIVDGKFVGLVLDEDNESDQTEARVAAWVEQIKGEF